MSADVLPGVSFLRRGCVDRCGRLEAQGAIGRPLYRLVVRIRSLRVAIRAPTKIVRQMPRRIPPPTIRGELNIPLMIILRASVLLNMWRLDIVPPEVKNRLSKRVDSP
jgi:hypothetical protein